MLTIEAYRSVVAGKAVVKRDGVHQKLSLLTHRSEGMADPGRLRMVHLQLIVRQVGFLADEQFCHLIGKQLIGRQGMVTKKQGGLSPFFKYDQDTTLHEHVLWRS
ncbi:MAG: hypothetical protein BWY72_02230 [Bacteroidetes bacterium ADurb.Bin416]|nr:MAG: hypothetical protein BWY72_02230 [Bacteroidetes bacterium ADurb.Bin416]